MRGLTSKFSILTALTLSLFATSACVVGDESADVDSIDHSEDAVEGVASVRMAGGKLEYSQDARGDTVPDFSFAGYRSGTEPIPRVDVVKEVSPVRGDNLENIQRAIDEVARRTPVNGRRGAILLKKGTYRISGTLRIRTSGIVLRGEGDGEDGTVLLSTSRDRRGIMIDIEGGGMRYGESVRITDNYVPVGAKSVTLRSTGGLARGDTIIIERPSTADWLEEIGMDRLPLKNGRNVSWRPGTRNVRAERVITNIQGNKVTFDAPLTTSLDQRWGGGTVQKVTRDDRISEVGVEFMRGISLERISGPRDQNMNHPRDFIMMTRVKNSWVQNVTGLRFSGHVVDVEKTGDVSKWITVRRSKALEPIGQRTGGNFYAFATNGQMTLFYDLESWDGRHDYITGGTGSQLNVFLESTRKTRLNADPRSAMGPHGDWASGTLFDNMDIDGGNLAVHDRLNGGSGQGWAAANAVIWNSTATDGFVCERPPTAHQWIFGGSGRVRGQHHRNTNMVCSDEVVSLGREMQPKSLYRQQLRERTDDATVRRVLDD